MDQKLDNTPTEETFPTVLGKEESRLSMLVGVGAFVIILAGLGWYFLRGVSQDVQVEKPLPTPVVQKAAPVVASTTLDAATAALSSQGTSDEVDAINSDLKATDLNSLNDIDKI
jgi:hypothetical protein